MLIREMDFETKAVMLWAHIVCHDPRESNLKMLKKRVKEWDSEHAVEQYENLMQVLNSLEDKA